MIHKVHQLGVMAMGLCSLLLLSACGKQREAETPLQRAERIFATINEKYKQELTVVSTEKDEKKIKKQLGKIVEDHKVKWKKIDTLNTIFVGTSYNPEKTPFHRYVDVMTSDIDRLKRYENILVASHADQMLEKSKDMRCMLLEIKHYLLKHKEYKAEDRYCSLRNEMVGQRRY